MSKSKKPKADYRYVISYGYRIVRKRVYGQTGDGRYLYTTEYHARIGAYPTSLNSVPARNAYKTPEAAINALTKRLATRSLQMEDSFNREREALRRIRDAAIKKYPGLDHSKLNLVAI